MRRGILKEECPTKLGIRKSELGIIMKEHNLILDKSKAFALRIINLYKYLIENGQVYALANQILRSGTSIGANVREAVRGQSKPDFYSKLGIALKEADETAYWLELLYESDYITKKQYDSLYADCNELIKLLVAITKTQKIPNS